MSALDVLKTWLSGGLPASLMPHLKLEHWTAAKDGKVIGPVTGAKIGLQGGTDFWGAFTFTEEGADHIIDCQRPLTGGPSTITFDGTDATGHVAFATHLKGFPPAVKLEIDVVIDGAGRFRFDAEVR